MKSTTKNELLEAFLKIISEKHPQLDEKVAWRVASDLSKYASELTLSHNKGISESYHKAIQDLEQHRKQFREHIEMIDKTVKTLFASFKRQGFFKAEVDKKTGRNKLVGRTAMVTEMVVFLNHLEDNVAEFYEKVYKIEEQNAKEIGATQISLFS